MLHNRRRRGAVGIRPRGAKKPGRPPGGNHDLAPHEGKRSPRRTTRAGFSPRHLAERPAAERPRPGTPNTYSGGPSGWRACKRGVGYCRGRVKQRPCRGGWETALRDHRDAKRRPSACLLSTCVDGSAKSRDPQPGGGLDSAFCGALNRGGIPGGSVNRLRRAGLRLDRNGGWSAARGMGEQETDSEVRSNGASARPVSWVSSEASPRVAARRLAGRVGDAAEDSQRRQCGAATTLSAPPGAEVCTLAGTGG